MRQQECSENLFCRSLSWETRALLCAMRSIVFYERRKNISFNTEQDGRIMLIRQGELLTVRERFNGRQKGIECLTAGDIVGISHVFETGELPIHLYVKDAVEACVFPMNQFEKLMLEKADLARAVIKNMAQRFAAAINQIEHMTLDNSEEKILYTLKMLDGQNDASHKSHGISLTHKELAILAGVNRITATREIVHLKSAGVLLTGRSKLKFHANLSDFSIRKRQYE